MGYEPPIGSIHKDNPLSIVLQNIFELDAWNPSLISPSDLEFVIGVNGYFETWECITPKQYAVLLNILNKYRDKV